MIRMKMNVQNAVQLFMKLILWNFSGMISKPRYSNNMTDTDGDILRWNKRDGVRRLSRGEFSVSN